MKEELIALIQDTVKALYKIKVVEVELSRPDEKFGDYATNVALKISKQLAKNPRDVATEIMEKIDFSKPKLLEELSIAGPGFINFKISDTELLKYSKKVKNGKLKGQSVVLDYSDPNPFKVLHIGHLYTTIVGDAISNILEFAGAKTHKVNFGGDVGMHVAKNIWAMLKDLGGENPKELKNIDKKLRSKWLSECYVKGNNAYEDNEKAKSEITELNKRLYEISITKDKTSNLAKIYWTTRQWSYDAFDQFYERIGSHFDKYIPESEISELGLKVVKENIPKVYVESDGAVVFKGEDHNLYTNVFINSQGLPTYAAKDVGLLFRKWQDYRFDESIVITSAEQEMYMKVVLKSVEQFRPDLALASKHFTHGFVKLAGGVKMSSRLGNIISAEELIDITKKANRHNEKDETVTLASVKYSFLKHRVGADIIYDPKESVSLEGNSGPYLQYAHARARSILAKVDISKLRVVNLYLESGERSLLRKLSEMNEVIEICVDELRPHYVCTYLYELTQEFNRFYEKNRVIGSEREKIRLKLVELYADQLKLGLELIGVVPLEKM